jgi:serine/threonine protein phosphatase PrpC
MAENFIGLTDTGKVRQKNEDTFIAQKAMNNKFIIACAIDGVGGYSGGEVAADIARQSILDYFKSPSRDMTLMMKEALIEANKKIYLERQHGKKHAEMACVLTLSIVDIENNQFYYAHVGDTRLYLLRDNSLVKVSKDHSFVGFLEDSGRLTEESAMRHPKRNEINKALGFGQQIEMEPEYIQTGKSPFLPGDILLLCSDGLTDMVNKKDMTSILLQDTSLEEKASKLISTANDNGGKDNITVVLVQNNKSPRTHEVTKPAGTKKEHAEKAEVIPVPEEKKNINSEKHLTHKQKTNPNIFLSILCVIFLVSTLYLLGKGSKKEDGEELAATPVQKVRNAQETALQHAIDTLTRDTLILSDSLFAQTIVITDTLQIRRDSLYILTKGNVTLRSDSTYTGPAFVLSSQCKYIVIDSLTLSNFDTAVYAQNNALVLKNVRFNNCRIPVQNIFMLAANQYINGRIPDTPFRADSLPKQNISRIIWKRSRLR